MSGFSRSYSTRREPLNTGVKNEVSTDAPPRARTRGPRPLLRVDKSPHRIGRSTDVVGVSHLSGGYTGSHDSLPQCECKCRCNAMLMKCNEMPRCLKGHNDMQCDAKRKCIVMLDDKLVANPNLPKKRGTRQD